MIKTMGVAEFQGVGTGQQYRYDKGGATDGATIEKHICTLWGARHLKRTRTMDCRL